MTPTAAEFAARFPGAVDSHAHVFGPAARFPFAPDSRYVPPDAPFDAHLAMLDRLGFARGVLVQGSAHGLDNRAMLDALDRAPERLRGVAVVPADASFETLSDLRARRVRGLRFFSDADGRHGGRTGLAAACGAAHALARAALHVQLLAPLTALHEASIRALAAAGVDVVIDHFGHPDPAAGVDHWAFRRLGDWVSAGWVWVKLSAVYRLRDDAGDASDLQAFHQALLRANPARLLWGSDWPHPNLGGPAPDAARERDRFLAWTPEPLARRILVDNPVALFGF